MFQENVEQVAAAELASKIKTGEYEAEIGGVSTYKSTKPDQSNSWIVNFVVAEGEFEGCEYLFFVTLKQGDKKASGFRASFYRNIGYVMPEDGAVDENTWVGNRAKVSIFNPSGSDPKITKVLKSAKSDESSDGPSNPPEFV
jgi:hypothetical protein